MWWLRGWLVGTLIVALELCGGSSRPGALPR